MSDRGGGRLASFDAQVRHAAAVASHVVSLGGYVHPGLKARPGSESDAGWIKGGGMGLFLEAGHVAEDGDLLLAVPISLLIVGKDHSALAARLLQERKRGLESPWSDYIASLPPILAHMPICWGGHPQCCAAFDALVRALPRFAQTCRELAAESERGRWKALGASHRSGHLEWEWAYACALSRAIRTSLGLALVPLVDFANHAHPANSVFGTRHTRSLTPPPVHEPENSSDSDSSSCSNSEEEIERAVARASRKRRERERAAAVALVDPDSFQFTLSAGRRVGGEICGQECLVSYGIKYDEAWVAHHGFLPVDSSSAGIAGPGDASTVCEALKELERLEVSSIRSADLTAVRALLTKVCQLPPPI